MIFVAAGTKDGRELAGFLLKHGYEIVASVVSEYGEKLLKAYPNINISCEALDEEGFSQYFHTNRIQLFVDASHPYAANVSKNAMIACTRTNIPYLRYERQQTQLNYEKAYYVNNYAEAAAKAAELGHNIFLTTGSRNLAAFAKASCLQDKRLVCRVLPEAEVIKEVRELGFLPTDIVALQGPFSLDLNKELYRKYQADVVVTKNSGQTGGTDTKFAAAVELGLPLVIVNRPKLDYVNQADDFAQVLDFVKRELG